MKLGTMLNDNASKQHSSVSISRIVGEKDGKEYRGMDLHPLGWQVMSVSAEQKSQKQHDVEELSQLKLKIEELQNQEKALQEQLKRDVSAAKAAGLAEGKLLGIREGKAESDAIYSTKLKSLKEEWKHFVIQLEQQKEHWVKNFEEDGLKLLVSSLKSLLGQSSPALCDAVVNATKQALLALAEEKNLCIRIHPSFLKSLQEEGSDLWAHLGAGTRSIVIEEDPHLVLGTVRVEARGTTSEASLDTWILQLEQSLQSIYLRRWGVEKHSNTSDKK